MFNVFLICYLFLYLYITRYIVSDNRLDIPQNEQKNLTE